MIRTPFFLRVLHGQILIWLLTIALPMQALACMVKAVRGPAHAYRQTGGAIVALEDLRYALSWTLFLDHRAAPDVDHVHALDLPQRRPHARFDPTVVKLGGAVDLADAGDCAAPASPAAAFVAVLPVPPLWHAGLRALFPVTSRDASFSSVPPAPPEKPPCAVA